MTEVTEFRAACLQVNATEDMDANIAAVSHLTGEATADGASMVFTPENVSMMTWGRRSTVEKAFSEDQHPALSAFRDLAVKHGIWFHIGSLTVLTDTERVANRSFVLDPAGDIKARYDKIHMFDVNLGKGERYAESTTFRPGAQAVVVDLPWGRLGLSICYDLRFPHLYRHLAQSGADLITVPSAFTQPTGEAHWHVLQRARAIENGVFVLAPAQTGTHANDRKTFGHSLIVDPWGKVLAEAGTDTGSVAADIDVSKVAKVRSQLPSLGNDREYADA